MNKQSFIFLLLLSSVVLTSCQVVLRTIYGVKHSKIKSTEEIMASASKHHLYGGEHVALSRSGSIETFSGNQTKSAIHYQVYNRDGLRVLPDSSKYIGCSTPNKFLRELNQFDNQFTVEGEYINDVLDRLFTLEGSREKLNLNPSEHHFTVFIYWATFAGSFNKPIAEWLENISQNEAMKILVVFVNYDMREWWEEPESKGVAAQ